MHPSELFNKNATLYQQKYMDVSPYYTSIDKFCSYIKNNRAEILEVACGPGNLTKYLLQQKPDFKILGTDLAPKMIELARLNNPAASFEVLDAKDVLSLNKKFDAVVCGFLLPYLSQEETKVFIRDLASVLQPGGILYLSTIQGDYKNSGPVKASTGDEIVMHFYDFPVLKEMLQENNLRVLEEFSLFNSVSGDQELIIIAKK